MSTADTPRSGAAAVTAPEVQLRVRRFASLRAAQRALSRTVHPSQLEQAIQQGRELLIELQKLNKRAEGGERLDAAAFEHVDALISAIGSHTREILERLEIANLRSTVPLLASEYPAEARGLVDLLLETGLEGDKALRMLEYIVTMLSSAERNGRRIIVRDPSTVTHRLDELSGERLARGDDELDAERTFSNASMRLHASEDLGAIRDRMRTLKEELGDGILHPRVLAAAVSYNVAMWNRIADLIEGSRSIDALMEELFSLDDEPEVEAEVQPNQAPAQPAAARDVAGARAVLDSLAFTRLVDAVRARVTRQDTPDEPARRCAAAFRLEGLSPAEIEAFDADEDDEGAALVRAATVIGLAARQPWDLEEPLHAMGLDPELLQTGCVLEVADAISGRARKLFADGSHDEAFRLSEVRTRRLAPLLGASSEKGARGPHRQAKRGFDLGLPPGLLAVVALLLALPVLASVLWSPSRERSRLEVYSSVQLKEISPFLESGQRLNLGERTDFEGRVGRAWDYLTPQQRLRVAAEIGATLRQLGFDSMILRDSWDRIHARFEQGEGVRLEQAAQMGAPAAPPPGAVP